MEVELANQGEIEPGERAFDPDEVEPGAELISQKALEAMVGLGRSTISRLVNRGLFPGPIVVPGMCRILWIKREIDEWIETRIAERDAALPKILRAPRYADPPGPRSKKPSSTAQSRRSSRRGKSMGK